MDRRATLRWILAAVTLAPTSKALSWGAGPTGFLITQYVPIQGGYGTDPNLLDIHRAGTLWPLVLTPAQRRTATSLSDLIVPADENSPSASQIGVIDFIDEWISAPYETQKADRKVLLKGLSWLNGEAERRFSKEFADLTSLEQTAICDDICYLPKAKPEFIRAATFFARYRDLTAGGYYTTSAGRQDLQYVGNIALTHFDGPPLAVLQQAGIA